MNTYETSFFCLCPINNVRVCYRLKITTDAIIAVEELLAHIARWYESGFHELIADHLHEAFGGDQTLVADHHSVIITTRRS
jgi:hypothetical protein